MDGSVTIGVSLDTSSVASSVAALQAQLSSVSSQLTSALLPSESLGGGLASSLFSGISEAVAACSEQLNSSVYALASGAAASFGSYPWSASGALAGTGLAAGISSASSSVSSAAGSVARGAEAAFAGGGWTSIGHSMMSGVASGIRAAGAEIVSAIRAVAEDAERAVKEYYQISSPSALMRDEVGVMISRGIAEGILDGGSYIRSALDSVRIDGYYEAGERSNTLTQNIYFRGDSASAYKTAMKIKKESEALLRRT